MKQAWVLISVKWMGLLRKPPNMALLAGMQRHIAHEVLSQMECSKREEESTWHVTMETWKRYEIYYLGEGIIYVKYSMIAAIYS